MIYRLPGFTLILVLLLLTGLGRSFGQQRCPSGKMPYLESEMQFEQWVQQKRKKLLENGRQLEVVTIPVVVHIIHQGETLGTGSNISDNQILSQIQVLNEDFRRTNADQINTPSEFQPVAADIEIQFELARQDPEGLPTNGIVRVNGGSNDWGLYNQYELKSLSYWPSEDYLNVWVTRLSDLFLGFAQFPESGLNGLDEASPYALTDGVVVHHEAFGSAAIDAEAELFDGYDLGRTTVHEVGHFFGLRHIWGDNSTCSTTGDDYCLDTPPATGPNTNLGIPCSFPGPASCGPSEMFQNYMDFTDDACMNLFTLDQKSRMRVVLENSPRRASLLNSRGLDDPISVANDLGIQNIIEPATFGCSGEVTPQITVRNYGNNTINAATITFSLNGNSQETVMISTTLTPLDATTVTFSSLAVSPINNQTFSFEITSVNSGADGNTLNNSKSIESDLAASFTPPIIENFSSLSGDWIILNPDNNFAWQTVNAANGEANNRALRTSFYDDDREGEWEVLLSPVIDLTNTGFTLLNFQVAYSSIVENEGLIVRVFDCSTEWYDGEIVYSKFDDDLATASPTGSPYTPTGSGSWRQESIDISSFSGSQVRLAFVAQNNFGNDLFLDNIEVTSIGVDEIALEDVSSPTIVSCPQNQELVFTIRNPNVVPLGSFDLRYEIDGVPSEETLTLNTPLEFNETITLSYEIGNVSLGTHELEVEVANPNGISDFRPDDNRVQFSFVIDNSTAEAPIRQNFDDINPSWIIGNPDGQETWTSINTNFNASYRIPGFTYSDLEEEDWLVSPSLDLSNTTFAELEFDVSYSIFENSDVLQVLVSDNCGQNYSLVAEWTGQDLATVDGSFTNFIPIDSEDWKTLKVNLSNYVGASEVRIAIVNINQFGNNLYIDNIQLFTTPGAVRNVELIYPNPTEGIVNIAFDRPVKEEVSVRIVSLSGKLLAQRTYPATLNQTYQADLNGLENGVYLVEVIGESVQFVSKVILER